MEEATSPTYLFSVNTLLSEHEQLLQQEQRDRALVDTIENPNVSELGAKLKQWAMEGFTYLYPVLFFSFSVPTVCSDGVTRTLAEYIQFLSGKELNTHIANLQSKLEGMTLHCEYTSSTSFHLRVSKV